MERTNHKLDSVTVGANLKRYIKEKYGTQAKFAEAFGADVKTVGRWCRGELDKFSLAQQLADFLEIDVFALLF